MVRALLGRRRARLGALQALGHQQDRLRQMHAQHGRNYEFFWCAGGPDLHRRPAARKGLVAGLRHVPGERRSPPAIRLLGHMPAAGLRGLTASSPDESSSRPDESVICGSWRWLPKTRPRRPTAWSPNAFRSRSSRVSSTRDAPSPQEAATSLRQSPPSRRACRRAIPPTTSGHAGLTHCWRVRPTGCLPTRPARAGQPPGRGRGARSTAESRLRR